MADNITVAKMYSILVANKPGEGERLLAALKAAGVNLTAAWGYAVSKKQSRIDLVADDPKTLAKVIRKLKIPIERMGEVFLTNGEDRVGALEEPFSRLATAGINIFASAAIYAGAGRYGAILHVDPGDVKNAKKVLGA